METLPTGRQAVAVLGAGNMGTALAQVIAGNGRAVRLWSIETDVLEEVRDRRRNSKYLDGLPLHPSIDASWDLSEAIRDAQLVIISVPSHIVRTVARDAAPHLQAGQLILSVAKGLEDGSHLRMSEVLAQELPPPMRFGMAGMGGPAIAAELARGVPTAVIVAAADRTVADSIQTTLQNDFLKVETTADLAGVELAATLKNAYAIALGMCDGLGHGTNTKAFVASLALEEMATLCRVSGGEERTVYGLAGLGDLLTTGYSAHSRNRTLGEKLVSDPDWREFVRTRTVEGISACEAAHHLGAAARLGTPLLDAIREALAGGEPGEAMRRFLRDFAFH